MTANIEFRIINDIHDSLSSVLYQLGEIEHTDIESIDKMAQTIIYLNESYLPLNADKIQANTIETISELSSSLANFITSYIEKDNGFSFLYFNDFNLTSYLNITAKHSIDGGYGGKSTI